MKLWAMVCNKFLVNSIKTKTLIYSIVLAVTPQPGEGPKPFPSLTTATTSTASVSGGGGGVASTMSTSTTTATTTLSSPFSLSSILQDKTESIQDLRWVAIGYNSQQYTFLYLFYENFTPGWKPKDTKKPLDSQKTKIETVHLSSLHYTNKYFRR